MEETRPDQVSLLVKASRDERPTKHTHGVVSTSRRETRGHSGVAWQHAPGTVPPSHNSWGALGSWIASDHLGLTSPHVLSGSGFCCISAAPGATPRALRSPLSALHSPLWLVTPDRPPRSQIEVQRQDQDFSTLFASSSRPCTRNPVQHVSGHQLTEPDARHAPPGCHSHPCKQAVGRPSNLHDEQDCQATQTLLSQVIHLWMLLKKRWPTYTTSSRCQVSR